VGAKNKKFYAIRKELSTAFFNISDRHPLLNNVSLPPKFY